MEAVTRVTPEGVKGSSPGPEIGPYGFVLKFGGGGEEYSPQTKWRVVGTQSRGQLGAVAWI